MDLKNIKHFVLFDGNGWFHGINLLDNYKENCWREKDLIVSETGNGSWNDFISSMKHNFDDLCNTFGKIVMIILVARLFFGWVFKKIGQPTVIGEIIAGIV
jgi:hypothetical protein